MSLTRGELHAHVEDGGIYELTESAAVLKDEHTGAWFAAVIYRNADPDSVRFGMVYATTEDRWCTRFRVRPKP